MEPTSKTMRIYMKFYAGGDLQNLIDRLRHDESPIYPPVALLLAAQIVEGVKTCHDRGIIHRDLKPANVLLTLPYDINDIYWAAESRKSLTEDQEKRLKNLSRGLNDKAGVRTSSIDDPSYPDRYYIGMIALTDFGLGKFVTDPTNTRATYSIMGTPGYWPPESLGPNGTFSTKSDIYSLGWVLFALFSGKSHSSIGVPGVISSAIPSTYPRAVRNLVQRCVDQSPANRPSIDEMVVDFRRVIREAFESFNYEETVRYLFKECVRWNRIRNPPDTRSDVVQVLAEMPNVLKKWSRGEWLP
jgi:serine/threonine protein kinase